MILTTVTPVWGRAEAFTYWLDALERAHTPGVVHMVFCVGQKKPPARNNFIFIEVESGPGEEQSRSIGYFHNLAAELMKTPWMMKLDLDAIPNELFFRDLLAVLQRSGSLDWFNAGMLYLNEGYSRAYLSEPLTIQGYQYLMSRRASVSMNGAQPGGSNFICRVAHYRQAGGCDPRFKGWGWEDYAQTFALETLRRGKPPLAQLPDASNVTRLCRDLVTRPKALELLNRSEWLCLMHRYHPPANRKFSQANKNILLENVLKHYGKSQP